MQRSWTQLQIEPHSSRPSSRRLQALYDLWHGKRGDSTIPSRDDIDPLLECDPRLVPHLFLLDVLENPTDFRFRLVGTALVAMEGSDNTGKRLGECGYGRYEALFRRTYEQVVADQAPHGFTGSLIWREKERLDLEALHLPLTRSSDKVEVILGTMLFSPAENILFMS